MLCGTWGPGRRLAVDSLRARTAFADRSRLSEALRGLWSARSSGCATRCAGESERFAQPWCGVVRCSNPAPLQVSLETRNPGAYQIRGSFRGLAARGGHRVQVPRRMGEGVSSLAPLLAAGLRHLAPVRRSRSGSTAFVAAATARVQSITLAWHAAWRKSCNVPVEECLLRTRRTDSQTRLQAEERQKNVHGAMARQAGKRDSRWDVRSHRRRHHDGLDACCMRLSSHAGRSVLGQSGDDMSGNVALFRPCV